MQFHAFIFCWPGQVANARHIYHELRPHLGRLTVLDSSPASVDTPPDQNWIKINPDYYYGHTLREALRLFEGNVLLQIQADAKTNNWPKLAKRCQKIHESIDNVGIWTPETSFTSWPTKRVRLFTVPNTKLECVARTDCIVWSLKQEIVEFLKTLDYQNNNLGWGIDLAAASYCYCNKLLAVRDPLVQVSHPRGSGYQHKEAKAQMDKFLRSLPYHIKIQNLILSKGIKDMTS